MATRSSRIRRLFVIFVVVLFVSSASWVLGWSSLFTVKSVEVIGAPNPSENFAIARLIRVGDKLARLESQTVVNSLKKYSWLDHAQVKKNWINGVVTLRVWTRTPIAIYEGHLVDSSGAVFDLPTNGAAQLPIIIGQDAKAAKFAADLLTQLPDAMRLQVTNVNVHGDNAAVLKINDAIRKMTINVAWGDLSNMSLKVQVYQALLALPENSKITMMDISAPHAPIVK